MEHKYIEHDTYKGVGCAVCGQSEAEHLVPILKKEIERLEALVKWTEFLYKPLPHDPMP